MGKYKKIAFLFPGQGSQYCGMGKDFFENFSSAKQIFEEADDILERKLSTIILDGPDQELTETRNSQVGIYVVSMAILRVVQELIPELKPTACSGLSLGEYTALVSAGNLSFQDGLLLIQRRGEFMNDACEATQGTMAVILGLSSEDVEKLVKEVNLPQDLWAANFNCPGQIVISGTLKGIEAGTAAAKAKGAKRVMPLQVHGAFHSGLMGQAEERLTEYIQAAPLQKSDSAAVVMNVPGDFVKDLNDMRTNLIKQVTSPVRWEQGIRKINEEGIDLFVEMGCGKTLSGFNKRIFDKRIEPTAPTISIEKVEDLVLLEKELNHE